MTLFCSDHDSSGVLVDTHAHVFHRGLKASPDRRYTPCYDATLDAYLAFLTNTGLTHGVLVQPSFLGLDNSFLLESLEKAQGRCRGVVVLDPAIDIATLERMSCIGVVGMRLNLFGVTPPNLAAASWQRLLEAVNLLGWHVEVHCPIEELTGVLQVLLAQECKVVVDHFGRPEFKTRFDIDQVGCLLDFASTGQVWVKLSAVYRIWSQQNPEQIKLLTGLFIRNFSPQRLMWGSDWPHTEHETLTVYQASLDWLTNSVEHQADRLQMLGETPKSLFKF